MKKIGLFIFTICISQLIVAQKSKNSNDSIPYRHELGLDATSFIKQFAVLNGINYGYSPFYYLTYRRHSKKSNFRMAFGGEYNNKNSARSNSDVRKYDLLRSFYYRVGYEYFKKVNPKFTMFYGADFRPSVSYNKTENSNQNSGYFIGTITDTKVLGVSPFLGAKFQLTPRLSLSTEAGISINYSEIKTRNYYVPSSGAFPDKMEDSHKNTYNWFSSFNNPVFLIFAFDF